MGSDTEIAHPVIFFDGVCNLCNASVNFIIKRDRNSLFRFSSLQSDYAKSTLPEKYIGSKLPGIVLMDNGFKDRSTAALHIARHLSGLWPLLTVFLIIPAFIRNLFYDLIAGNRYKLFGRRDECMIPSEEVKNRFID